MISSKSSPSGQGRQARRGEIWLVSFDPTMGEEIRKTRPAVVISTDAASSIRLRLAVPVTTWQPKFQGRFGYLKLDADARNGLSNDSAVNMFQVRCMSTDRFITRLGVVPADVMEEIVAFIASVIEYV
ncbi:MAG: type II toxin-antitoxin system PemK/MazF family toxin [Actinobacteria bacterium]|nr:type II toxin-antitoxin system PemK/MazF family toxin [Actinomycetota bacterium]